MDSNPSGTGLYGYSGQPAFVTLADGRELSAGEVIGRAFADYREINPDLSETEARQAWNAMLEASRRVFVTGCLVEWNSALQDGAAAVDAANPLTQAVVADAHALLGTALVDAALTEVKALARPWQQMTADQQSAVLERITGQVRAAVGDTIRLLQTEGRVHIVAELESITVKKGAKATLDIPKGELDQDVLDAVGQSVILVVGPALTAAQDIPTPKPDPDQRSLLDPDSLAQHSDPKD